MTKLVLTLCMVFQEDKILLGMKKRSFGEGLWNGFGGKIEQGETIEQSALRELKEESGIEAREIKKFGILDFAFENDPKVLEVHIFKIEKFNGEPVETEEMKPEWFPIDKIPFSQMWSDDKYWFPYLLEEKFFKGNFLFDRPSGPTYSAKIISHELFEVDTLDK